MTEQVLEKQLQLPEAPAIPGVGHLVLSSEGVLVPVIPGAPEKPLEGVVVSSDQVIDRETFFPNTDLVPWVGNLPAPKKNYEPGERIGDGRTDWYNPERDSLESVTDTSSGRALRRVRGEPIPEPAVMVELHRDADQALGVAVTTNEALLTIGEEHGELPAFTGALKAALPHRVPATPETDRAPEGNVASAPAEAPAEPQLEAFAPILGSVEAVTASRENTGDVPVPGVQGLEMKDGALVIDGQVIGEDLMEYMLVSADAKQLLTRISEYRTLPPELEHELPGLLGRIEMQIGTLRLHLKKVQANPDALVKKMPELAVRDAGELQDRSGLQHGETASSELVRFGETTEAMEIDALARTITGLRKQL
jgi:hypothetical protein